MHAHIPSRSKLETWLNQPPPRAQLNWLASIIDHTLLKPEATHDQIHQLCDEALQHQFGAVCVRLAHVEYCARLLLDSGVKVCSVVGFPSGLESTKAKVAETREAIALGAEEIDMVINVRLIQRRRLRTAYLDIRAVVKAAGDAPVKVILETSALSLEEKLLAGALAKAAGAAFLKTSTGFAGGGATEADVALLRDIARRRMGVKASGGVKNLDAALRMVLAGADRIGTSSGVAILGESPAFPQSGAY